MEALLGAFHILHELRDREPRGRDPAAGHILQGLARQLTLLGR